MVPATTTEDQHSVVQSDGKKLYKCGYLPHHGVVKETSSTNNNKLRTVFDASCITNNGSVGFKADITQMYLQILISDPDSEYQHLLWRFDPSEPLLDYKLKTVRFGTAAAHIWLFEQCIS